MGSPVGAQKRKLDEKKKCGGGRRSGETRKIGFVIWSAQRNMVEEKNPKRGFFYTSTHFDVQKKGQPLFWKDNRRLRKKEFKRKPAPSNPPHKERFLLPL